MGKFRVCGSAPCKGYKRKRLSDGSSENSTVRQSKKQRKTNNMSRKKRYIKGKVYITNDKVLVGGQGKKRAVVSMGNDKNNMAVRRISSLYAQNGKKKERLIPIEKYPDIKKESGVEDKTFRKTKSGKSIQEKYLGKTKTRLNKWDMEKIRRGRNKPKNKG